MSLLSVKLDVNYNLKKNLTNLDKGTKKGLEAAMFRWETVAKLLTTTEKHVITGRYRASINSNTSDGFTHPPAAGSEAGDGIHEVIKPNFIKGGSNVKYAIHLEKRYGIFLRALDKSKDKMVKSFGETIAHYL